MARPLLSVAAASSGMSGQDGAHVLLGADDLRHYASALLTAGGFTEPQARQTADLLVWANIRGVESHGVLRIPRYVEMVESGLIDPAAEPLIVRRDGAVSLLEARRAPGATAMVAAMAEAIDSASQFGVGWCCARGITHAGAVGYYALEAARRGYIGIVMTASGPLMAYHGSRVSGVSTNPIAIAAPSTGDPILLDMSTATVALGKIMAARDAGTAIPETWGLDGEGQPTTDPADVATLTPLGGPKGSGLSLMIEIIVSLLVANPVIAPALEGAGNAGMNGLALAMRIGAAGDLAPFRLEVDRLAAAVRGLPRAAGVESILMPGERGFDMAAKRQKEGIPLSAGTFKRLSALGQRYGVAAPSALDAGPSHA
jgi:ureidoglycolate dehydrogenase (NAD+)